MNFPAMKPATRASLRGRAPNLAGLKVSDAPFTRVAPYLNEGLDVFVGAEALIDEARAAGCAGAVSGLAAAYPEAVAEVVARPTPQGALGLGELRAAVENCWRTPPIALAVEPEATSPRSQRRTSRAPRSARW